MPDIAHRADTPPRRTRRRAGMVAVTFAVVLLTAGCATDEEIAETTAALDILAAELTGTYDEVTYLSATYDRTAGFHQVGSVQIRVQGDFDDRAHLDRTAHLLIYDIWHSDTPQVNSVVLLFQVDERVAGTASRPDATDVSYRYTGDQLDTWFGDR